MQPAVLCLGQGISHDLTVNTFDFDVHLQSGNALAGSYNLEVHITKMILITQNIGENNDLVTFLDKSHGNTGNRGLDWNTGIHQSQAGSADRGHGG